ncbi:NAD(P)H-dependent oxidoreductase [Pseudomonas sp. ZM23]|uniref:FMN dependent NADH:quinone oxidoreductase n=1 Tax=Pseudomonas triclosanedens TaxID=2961893 RepID=A0ABY7A1F9_9PSED|nr:NAD(P)H-dependent oxidoreductase [Pseudomonas triclosanedens]MCP8464470.1 NAD(P)H-dependent oxidoreductase [Pseudomonas triclosanedens]MCP8471604.1 NAD(P)H-dependent oxidoreductase [Pseudomonas triclosanedens]MCP8477584.1 NAD(P)H-dependent oxidoreductase [Pseudomonas triclosanedens]WAI51047.1 NAD(P)H-dependent oxidoreductase [Pseudomonas triclosanedens]
MNRILAIHASPRAERSHSRRLAEGFLAALPQAKITRREVGRADLPHVNEAFIAAAFHSEPGNRPLTMQADLALSDQLVDELLDHDLLVISTPMYNFSVPSGLKAWVDQVVRLGRTFDLRIEDGEAQYEPLLKGRKALIVTSRGGAGMGPGGELEWMNHADTWLRVALGFLGIEDVKVIAAEGEEGNPDAFRASCQQAERELASLAESQWTRP